MYAADLAYALAVNKDNGFLAGMQVLPAPALIANAGNAEGTEELLEHTLKGEEALARAEADSAEHPALFGQIVVVVEMDVSYLEEAAVLVDTAEQVIELIRSGGAGHVDTDGMFEPDAMRNICKFIDEVINK